MPSDPTRPVIRAIVTRALAEYIGKLSGWDGNLRDGFVERLAVLCAMSEPFLSPDEAEALAYDCRVFSPAQIEQLTGERQPNQSRDRRLTAYEIGLVVNYAEATVQRRLKRAYEKLADRLPPEMLGQNDARSA